jgi:hypothetical protein
MRPAGRRCWRSGRRDRSAGSRRVRRTTLRAAAVRAGRVRSTGAWRRRHGRVWRPTERPRGLARCRARRIWAGRVRTRCIWAGRIRIGRIGTGSHRTVRMAARSVRFRVGVRPRVVRTGMVAMRIGWRYPATRRNRAARTPRSRTSTWPAGRRRAPRARSRRVRARRWHPGWHRSVHGGRGLRSGSVRAAALLRDRGAAGPGWQRGLRAPPSVGTSGWTSLILVVVGLTRIDSLPGHGRDAGPGRRGGAGAFVTLVVAHAASPRP